MKESTKQKSSEMTGGQSYRFSFVSDNPNCGILIYDKNSGELISKIPFEEHERIGYVYTKEVTQQLNQITYLYYKGDELFPDVKGRAFAAKEPFGTKLAAEDLKAYAVTNEYAWGDDKRPVVPYDNALLYTMHVRGFTRNSNSGVSAPGTFLGIQEKIPYLKGIGVTSVLLQPAYEFIEFLKPTVSKNRTSVMKRPQERVNYWGYTQGYYYAPKANYAHSDDAVTEMKNMIKAFHRNHMELLMQFYFPDEFGRSDIVNILKFWLTEYHVDGFQIMGNCLPIDLIAKEPLLGDCKILYYQFSESADFLHHYPHLSCCNDEYLNTMRKFLKGDESMLNSALYQMRYIPADMGRVHYLSNYNGFTLTDMVTYEQKHNEDNGEENRDGTDYNCSWNCGEEGPTKSRKVSKLRMQQLKNAVAFLLLTSSTPMIFMGDEFGNTQNGNNNPYCQDNETTWLDWSLVKKKNPLCDFWKQMVMFRNNHPQIAPSKEWLLADTKSCGYPDMSYHGESAWKLNSDGYLRYAGIMMCGNKCDETGKQENNFLYLAINMHWEKHHLAMPKLPKGMYWKEIMTTVQGISREEETPGENTILCFPRTISIYEGTMLPEKKQDTKKANQSEREAVKTNE